MANTRIEYIDSLKGVGIILVMMSHMISCKYFTPLYGGFIPLFFIASGLTSNKIDITSLILKKKASRLLIPYLFYSVSIIFAYYMFSLDKNVLQNIVGILYARCRLMKDYDFEQSIRLLPREIAPLWFLPAMFMSYISLYLSKNGGVILLILITVIAAKLPLVWLWSLDTSFIHGIFIIIGFKYKEYFKSISFKWVLVMVIVYLLIFYFNKMPNISLSLYGALGVFSILCYVVLGIMETTIILYFVKSMDKFKISSILKYFGKNSLRFMCIHMGVYTYFNDFCNLPKYIEVILTLLVTFMITNIIDIIVSHYGDKNILLKSI